MTETVCPHCAAPAPVAAGVGPGEAVDCQACDRSFLIPLPSAAELAAQSGFGPLSSTHSAGDVGLGFTGAVAAALTLAFYLVVVGPLEQSYFGQLFGNRGWVPYVISYFAFWSAAILVTRYRRLLVQNRVFSLDLLPLQIGERITPERAPEFSAVLAQLSEELPDNFLIRRLIRGLEHFAIRASVAETMDQLRLQSERDENSIESSYSMLRVFIWAIPILGFIGTVVGIGAAVGGFSDAVSSAADLDVMKDSIGVVTSGLGVAFDTTLLALVTSIFIMFPTSSLQKAEEDYLARVDDFCQRQLVSRLQAEEAAPVGSNLAPWAERLADALIDALARRDSIGSD